MGGAGTPHPSSKPDDIGSRNLLRELESVVIMAEINSPLNLEPFGLAVSGHVAAAPAASVNRTQALRPDRKLQMRFLTVLELGHLLTYRF
jgi:hypothetical protein